MKIQGAMFPLLSNKLETFRVESELAQVQIRMFSVLRYQYIILHYILKNANILLQYLCPQNNIMTP